MSTTTLQHLTDEHPLELVGLCNESIAPDCDLCGREILAEAYTCQQCISFYHRACAEAPPQIDHHPLHPIHPLALIHRCPCFRCDACNELLNSGGSSFSCNECEFNLDISCALSTLSDKGRSPGGTTPEQITLSLHPHPLTFFSTRRDFIGDYNCGICRERVEGDGYMCLCRGCECLIHKRCVQDPYYADGTKAPRVYHNHPLDTFVGEDTGSRRCAHCESDKSGEFIGCSSCEVFYHRDCVQVPEILHYPLHSGHTLVLFISCPDNLDLPQCGSCSSFMEGELCYCCTICKFLVHVKCALQVLAYCEEDMNVEIRLSWHEHPLLLCHRTGSYCSYCGDESAGPMYACKEDCKFLFHRRCIEIDSTMIHPYHPDHPLTLGSGNDWRRCKACCQQIFGLNFSCKLCRLYLHVKCATRVPTRKHYLHEHELIRLDKVPSWNCNHCGASTDSRFFRCVLCDFNIHEKCIEIPRVLNSKVHWHPLTLLESYVEDNSGEYYCDHCEKGRDVRRGVYVCKQCTARWAYHLECILPELQKMYAKKDNTADIEILAKEIAKREEEIHETERKLNVMKYEVDELKKKHAALTVE